MNRLQDTPANTRKKGWSVADGLFQAHADGRISPRINPDEERIHGRRACL
jgi:hypothetical protein